MIPLITNGGIDVNTASRRVPAAILCGLLVAALPAPARAAEAPSEVTVIPGDTRSVGNAGVTITSGVVRHVEQLANGTFYVYNHQLAADATDTKRPNGGPLDEPVPCETGVACVRTVDGNHYGTMYVSKKALEPTAVVMSREDTNTSHIEQVLPPTTGQVIDASYRYVLVRGTTQQYVVDPGYDSYKAGPVTGAGLWFDTLWSATKAGYLEPRDLPSNKAGTLAATGSPCTATEVQPAARHVYWSCGANGPAGVYDLARKANIALPAGQYQLGDNYVVRHDENGELLRYDLTGGTLGDPVELADYPRGIHADDRNITWAVDRFGGDVAWVDSRNAVHVVDAGVARSAPAAAPSSDAPASTVDFGPYGNWSHVVLLTRPVDSWKLTVTQVSTGQVVHTAAGGPARTEFLLGWNGYVAGQYGSSGHYRWTVSVTAGGTTTTIGSSVLTVLCGVPNFRSFECTGEPSILGTRSSPAGEGHWLVTNPGGTSMRDNGWTETWRWTDHTAIVPFGDISKDRQNDLLVRSKNGTLRVYLGFGQSYFGQNKSLVVAGNWNRYNALVHTGDLSGDGQSDLIARDSASGALYRYNGNGKGGFTAPVKLAGGYKGYSRVIGPGDIDGDGKADLLLLYGTTLYALHGTGTGTFQPGLRLVSTGWAGYNTIIGAGDLNEDGQNDLVTRDAAGNLYRMLGNGTGGFGSRLRIGTGYQKYAYLY